MDAFHLMKLANDMMTVVRQRLSQQTKHRRAAATEFSPNPATYENTFSTQVPKGAQGLGTLARTDASRRIGPVGVKSKRPGDGLRIAIPVNQDRLRGRDSQPRYLITTGTPQGVVLSADPRKGATADVDVGVVRPDEGSP